MKLLDRFKQQPPQTRWMIILILVLLLLIATRWGYISHTASQAFSQPVTRAMEQPDSL